MGSVECIVLAMVIQACHPIVTQRASRNDIIPKSGERGRNRTFNLLIKSQLLCQLSYAPTVGILAGWTNKKL